MLSIRMQRTGRKNHAQYRLIVQDSRFNPKSGRVVANLGAYNPHTKAIDLDIVKANEYLANGAQPSPRAAHVLSANGVTMPAWVIAPNGKSRAIRNSEKLRRNQPKEEVVEEPVAEEAVADAPAEEASADEKPAE